MVYRRFTGPKLAVYSFLIPNENPHFVRRFAFAKDKQRGLLTEETSRYSTRRHNGKRRLVNFPKPTEEIIISKVYQHLFYNEVVKAFREPRETTRVRDILNKLKSK